MSDGSVTIKIKRMIGGNVALTPMGEKRGSTMNTSLRQALLTRLGHFPQRVALAPVFDTEIDEGTHVRRLVTYKVEADEYVPAWLLTPKGVAPQEGWPAILAIHQHGGQYDLGKSELVGLRGDPQYAYGRELCQRGYVVLCPDMLCFEERRPLEEMRRGNDRLDGLGYERFEFTKRLINGSCLQTKYLHDLSCALDLLTSLPNVAAARLGVIGHSLGGQEALWLTWYDPRVTAAVSSCGFSLMRAILRDGINHNFAAYVPDMLAVGDMDTLVAELALRPFLLTAGESDPIFPIDGVHTVVGRARQIYGQQNVAERFQAVLFPGGHSFPAEVKVQAYVFFDHWLK
jgi:dienelactone hydrolase